MPSLPPEDGPREDAALRRLRSRSPHVLPQTQAEVCATGGSLKKLFLCR